MEKAIILAAGFGSRLMPLTKDNPKCMVEYFGKKIIDYELEALRAAGIAEIAVVGGYKIEVLEAFLKERGITNIFCNSKYDSTNMVQTLFCARSWLESCILEQKDLIVSYADIVYFSDTINALKGCSAPLGIVVDKNWQELWEKRFSNILDDAETLKLNGDKITELGKKPKSIDEIQAQYIGLFKISHSFLKEVLSFYDSLDRGAIFDGKDFNNMYMTSFLQALIDAFKCAQAVEIYGNWCEIDFKSDLEIKIKD